MKYPKRKRKHPSSAALLKNQDKSEMVFIMGTSNVTFFIKLSDSIKEYDQRNRITKTN